MTLFGSLRAAAMSWQHGVDLKSRLKPGATMLLSTGRRADLLPGLRPTV